MRIGIVGGTGFVGSALARRLGASGHEVVVARADIGDIRALADAFDGCDAVANCAGINREMGARTYAAVHVAGTRAVVDACRAAGVGRLVTLSFLRARPDGPTEYHRSKWAAEEIVRGSGLIWTIVKPGVIHGRGDHMLDHLSHAFHTFPVFGLVGLRERSIAPIAVEDVARILEAAVTGDRRLAGRTVAVLGPEVMALGEAVRRVARVTGRRPLFLRLPIAAHLAIGRLAEWLMRVPLISLAQVRILEEGIVEPARAPDPLPADLAPTTPFSDDVIRAGLPPAGGFGCSDLRWCIG